MAPASGRGLLRREVRRLEIKESSTVVKEMHGSFRDLLGSTFKKSTDVEIQCMLSRMFENSKGVVTAISTTKGFPYITYARDPKDAYNNRVLTRCGRWYSGSLHPEAPAPLVGRMMDALTAEATKMGYVLGEDLKVNVLRGEEIYRAYEKMVGVHSCMTEGNAYLTWLYVFNPETIGLATTSTGKARALLWTTDEGHTVLDRIYPPSGFNAMFLRNWALEQGYLVRNSNAASSSEYFIDKNGKKYGAMHVSIKKLHPRHFMPYIDTFVYITKLPSKNMKLTMRDESGYMPCSAVAQLRVERVGPQYGVLPTWVTQHRAPTEVVE